MKEEDIRNCVMKWLGPGSLVVGKDLPPIQNQNFLQLHPVC